MSSDVLTPQQLGDRLGMTPAALANLRYRGDGPVFMRIGRRTIRYRLADVLAYEEAQRFSRTDTHAPVGAA